ncbi:MAG: translocation/assembly module TamB domain-containing protein [Tolypothrix carrinoi HA7290-LM1]|jgi:translocation and assembly module TamB|nr:translocation/assembly module TamB domain-containing protein [Tolypothrix carrinoi HA7290-LM1]
MANSPHQDPNFNARANKRFWFLVLSRGGIALGGLLLLGLIGGAWRLSIFVQKELAPLAEQNLTTSLNRPVKLGKVKGFSLTKVSFGSSAIPATPTDPDRVAIGGVDVGFDILQLLTKRRLKLDVTLVNPDLYIEQDQQGRWITTSIAPPGKSGAIKTDLDKIRFSNAQLVLVPYRETGGLGGLGGQGGQGGQGGLGGQGGQGGQGGLGGQGGQISPLSSSSPSSPPLPLPPSPTPATVAFSQLNGSAQFLENNKLIRFDLQGLPGTGGTIALGGDVRVEGGGIGEAKLRVQAQDFLASDITSLIKLPLILEAGRTNGNLQVELNGKKQPLLQGSASLQAVRFQIPKVPQPFINSQGNLNFQGTQIKVDNVATSYGKIPVVANGIIDTKTGFKLTARSQPVSVANALETLKVKSPLAVTGEVKTDLQIGGGISQPFLSGTVVSTKPAKIDKVDLDSFSSKFDFSTAASLITLKDIQGKVKLGGDVTGGGTIALGKVPQINVNFRAKNLPGDVLAKVYDVNTSNVQIGTVSGNANLSGGGGNVQTVVDFQAPQATYPTSGEIAIAPDKSISFRNVVASLPGGTVQASGSFANQRWQAVAQTQGLQLEPFINKQQLQNVSLAGAELNGRFTLSGTTGPFQIAKIDSDNGRVQIGGGTVAISNIKLQDQNVSAQLIASGVRLGRVLKKTPPILQAPLAGKFQIAGNRENFSLKTLQATGEARLGVAGGTVTAANIRLADGVYQAQVRANDVAVQELSPAAKDFRGRLNGQFQVAGSAESITPETIQATGQARVNVGNGTVTASNIQLANGVYQAQVQANNVSLQRLPSVPPQLQGDLNGQFNVAGSATSFQPETIQASGRARVNFGKGTVTASNIQLANGRYQAQVQANNLPLQRLPSVPPQFQGDLNGQFNVAGSLEPSQRQNIQATGQARVNFGKGTVTASNIQLANNRYQAQIIADNLPLQRLAKVPPQFQGDLNGQFNVAGSLEPSQRQNIQATGEARVNVAGGTVTASNIQLANGRYEALVAASGVELNRFNQQLRGDLGGELQVAGTVASPKLSDVRAAGDVQLSQGIPGLEKPLNAAIAWNGQKLTIVKATAQDLNVSGDIFVNAKGSIPEITNLNLNVQAQNYNLQQLPIKLPNAVALAGKADFSGQITGKLPLPNVEGQLNLRDLVVNNLAFEPVLSGKVESVQGRGLNLNLAGTRDRIAFNLNENNRPESFVVQWQQASAIGRSQGDNLAVQVRDFPLQVLKLNPPPNIRLGVGAIAGLISADLEVNQRTFATTGNINIDKPEVGRIKGDRFAAQFSYNNGIATLKNSEFAKGNSRYAFSGTFNQNGKTPQLQAKVNINQGNIQDVLLVAQLFEIQDFQRGAEAPTYGKAADLVTIPQGLPNQSLFTQLLRFNEIDALLAQQDQQQRDASPLPALADLTGTFNGEVAVETGTNKGFAVNFDLDGQNFVWGAKDEQNQCLEIDRCYSAEKVIAEGSLENGVLRLLPLRLESQNRLIAFTGVIGSEEQSGQLQVSNFPIGVLNNFVKLPIGFTGNLDASAALAGSIKNPQARGELQVTDGTLNQKPIESAAATFAYADGRLNFGSRVTVSGPEPVNISGSIPYQFPFASAAPDSNEIQLDVKVKNEGLALLNLFTNQVALENGQGEIDLTVRGTRQDPVVNGIASINNGVFSAQALPGQLTDVNGRVLFNFNSILVENLQGNYSRGKVAAAGEIPISNNRQVQINNPLRVTLDQLALNLKGLYQGGVSGNVTITGAALSPIIGGKVQLTNGQVLLAESNNATNPGTNNVGVPPQTKALKQNKNNPTNGAATTTTRFNNLEIELAKNVKVTRPPLISFGATGTLTINGALGNLLPDGTITLRNGGVNLYTTQFNLARGYEQTAIFTPERGLDPELNVRLFAKVLDTVPNRVPTTSVSSEINDSDGLIPNFEPIRTIQVEARVEGLASQLNQNLELTSSPARSETEIVALLGGSFVNTLGSGDSTLALANLAGSALNLQGTFNQIGNAFGLSEFRLFPTISAVSDSSSLELGAEAGIDITPRISFSGIKILTAEDPLQLGVNYRINDNLRLRGSAPLFSNSNCSAASGNDEDNFATYSCGINAVLEYEKRF